MLFRSEDSLEEVAELNSQIENKEKEIEEYNEQLNDLDDTETEKKEEIFEAIEKRNEEIEKIQEKITAIDVDTSGLDSLKEEAEKCRDTYVTSIDNVIRKYQNLTDALAEYNKKSEASFKNKAAVGSSCAESLKTVVDLSKKKSTRQNIEDTIFSGAEKSFEEEYGNTNKEVNDELKKIQKIGRASCRERV